jgi:Fcf2 pre-rRNA processing
MTPLLKRDLQLIEMRSVLDPHRHYKKTSGKKKVPAFSQIGTVIEGPTEWYSSRINKKDRTKNFVEEAMTGERENGRFKRKYDEIQEKKTSGKKSYYKALMDKRKKRK